MFRCIECGTKYQHNSEKTTFCKNCHQNCDKYFEFSDTIKLLDILLMKKEIFRHYIFNYEGNSKLLKFGILMILCKIIYRIEKTCKYSGIGNIMICIGNCLLEFLFYFSMILLTYRKNDGITYKNVFDAIVVSSYYYLFILFIILWQYESVQYFYLLEVLTAFSNSVALSSMKSRESKFNGFYILFWKIASVFLFLYKI